MLVLQPFIFYVLLFLVLLDEPSIQTRNELPEFEDSDTTSEDESFLPEHIKGYFFMMVEWNMMMKSMSR